MTDELLRRCIVCEKDIRLVPSGQPTMPLSAVVFRAVGNYGSDVYDPAQFDKHDTHLRVYICDPCVEAKSSNGMIELVRLMTTTSVQQTAWRPGKRFVS